MKYKDLLKILQSMDKERLEDTVSVFDPYQDGFKALIHANPEDETESDDLEVGHFCLNLK